MEVDRILPIGKVLEASIIPDASHKAAASWFARTHAPSGSGLADA